MLSILARIVRAAVDRYRERQARLDAELERVQIEALKRLYPKKIKKDLTTPRD